MHVLGRKTTKHPGRARERGAAAVEFAFAVFPLLALLWGAVDLGAAMNLRYRMANIAHVAAQVCTANRTPTQACAQGIVNGADLRGNCAVAATTAALTLPGSGLGIAAQSRFRVEVTCEATFFIFLDMNDLSAAAVMPYVEWLLAWPAPP